MTTGRGGEKIMVGLQGRDAEVTCGISGRTAFWGSYAARIDWFPGGCATRRLRVGRWFSGSFGGTPCSPLSHESLAGTGVLRVHLGAPELVEASGPLCVATDSLEGGGDLVSFLLGQVTVA